MPTTPRRRRSCRRAEERGSWSDTSALTSCLTSRDREGAVQRSPLPHGRGSSLHVWQTTRGYAAGRGCLSFFSGVVAGGAPETNGGKRTFSPEVVDSLSVGEVRFRTPRTPPSTHHPGPPRNSPR